MILGLLSIDYSILCLRVTTSEWCNNFVAYYLYARRELFDKKNHWLGFFLAKCNYSTSSKI